MTSSEVTDLLRKGFFSGDEPRALHQHETPLALAVLAETSGITTEELRALALAVRSIADEVALEPEAPVTEAQREQLKALSQEVPRILAQVLVVGGEQITQRKELYLLVGILLASVDRRSALDAL